MNPTILLRVVDPAPVRAGIFFVGSSVKIFPDSCFTTPYHGVVGGGN
jgi:hypothetical protein